MDEIRAPELPPYRPPSEAHSTLVRVTRGCAWNRCTFCGMYKELGFEVRPRAEIEVDLRALARERPETRSVFLADSDALVHPEIVEIVAAARAAFPRAERITSYTRLHTLRQRPLERWRALREAGLTRLHVGLESGDDETLASVHKGTTSEAAIEAGRKALAADLHLCFYVLSGLGGEARSEAHARATARVVAAVRPHFVRLRTLVVLPGTPLAAAMESGAWQPVSPLARLRETELLIGEIARALGAEPGPREVEIASDHFSNYVWVDGELAYGGVNGFLPSDAELLLAQLSGAIATARAGRQVLDPASLARSGRGASVYRAL